MMMIPTRAARAAVDPAIMFTRGELDDLVERQVIEEATIRASAGQLPMRDDELERLRGFIVFRICAEITPAGNA